MIVDNIWPMPRMKNDGNLKKNQETELSQFGFKRENIHFLS